jgi:Thioredoxin domain
MRQEPVMDTIGTATDRQPAVITVVHSPACHFCEDAQAALEALSRELPFTVELLDVREPRGAALINEHRAGMYPLILVDGAFFSVGRLPRKKLRKLLEARSAVAVA